MITHYGKSLLQEAREKLEDDSGGCNALLDGEVCGEKVFGRASWCNKRYCRDHVPTGAVPGLVRTNPIEWSDEVDDE